MSGGGDTGVKDTPEQRELAAIAAEKWNFAQENLAPLEDEYIRHVGQMDSAANKSYIRGRTMQAQNQAQSQAQEQLHDGLTGAGINPNSGRHAAETQGLGLDLGAAGGENLGRAEFEQDSQKIQGLQNITAIGQGQAGQAQAGLSRLSQESTSNAINSAQNAFNRRSANLQLVGNLAGAGARYGMEGINPGGTGTDNGTFERTQYNHDVGKGGF